MVTLGIDLAAEPKDTGGCLIDWRAGQALVAHVSTGLSDADILAKAQGAAAIGIDSPFGWPTFFVQAITAHHAGKRWPVGLWERTDRQRLRLRATDEQVKAATGLSPMSVSSDRIAIPAMRCAGLLDRLGVKDRSGDGRVFEVYPAAALRAWGLAHEGYKRRENVAHLANLLAALRTAAPWLAISDAEAQFCASSDHAFDALVAALVARAAAKGLTSRPSAEVQPQARVEGWIALPTPGSLTALA